MTHQTLGILDTHQEEISLAWPDFFDKLEVSDRRHESLPFCDDLFDALVEPGKVGLGFAMTLGEVETGSLGRSDYYWGGAASTIFWVDPIEDLVVIFMTQLMPSNTFNFRGQIKNIVYGAIED